MKYQAIKHLKTKSKVLGIFETIGEAREAIRASDPEAARQGDSYVGGFPYYQNTYKQDSRPFTIQGKSEKFGIVCSLTNEDKSKLID